MASDISRSSEDAPGRYKGVVLQQGRVILDRDFNALQENIDTRIDAEALDVVGPCGTPDGGFTIGAPFQRIRLLNPTAPITGRDFSIKSGTLYVGGQRAVIPPFTGANSRSYLLQPDWSSPDPFDNSAAQEFVYLHLSEQQVGAVEDPDLRDVALGGPDTTGRTRLIKRVKRMNVGSPDCTLASNEAQANWLNKGWSFDTASLRILSTVSLKVSFAQTSSGPISPCDPTVAGGYLGSNNQLIRVQISDGGVTPPVSQLLWGFDNASFLYRASLKPGTQDTLLLNQPPVDAFHIPQANQVIEVLRTGVIIDTETDATNPSQTVTRCVTEATGFVTTLTAAQGTDLSLSLATPLPAAYVQDTNPLFIRIWQGSAPYPANEATPVALIDPTTNANTGVLVSIQTASNSPSGSTPPIGAYWLLALRPNTPQAVYPQRLMAGFQPPDGPRQWACPLGTIAWGPVAGQATVHNCPLQFDNLVALSQRTLGGCCSVTLHPQDLTADANALQAALDKFASAAQGAPGIAICLTPGTYNLSKPLQLGPQHNGITIEACHGAVTIQAAAVAVNQFLNGLVVLAESTGVTLRGLTFIAPVVNLNTAIAGQANINSNLQPASQQFVNPNVLICLRLQDCTQLTVQACLFQINVSNLSTYLAAAIFASGQCTQLKICDNVFAGPPRTPPRILRPFPLIGVDFLAASKTAVAFRSTAVLPSAVMLSVAGTPTPTPPPTPTPTATTSANLGKAIEFRSIVTRINPAVLDPADAALHIGPIHLPVITLPKSINAFLMAPTIGVQPAAAPAAPNQPPPAPPPAPLVSAALLDELDFSGNRMEGLTVGVLGCAAVGKIKFRDNLLTDCIGGIWFGTVSQDNVHGLQDFLSGLTTYVQQAKDSATAIKLAMWYPLPQAAANANPAYLPAQFHVVDNRLNAIPNDNSASGPACLLWMYGDSTSDEAPADLNSSILLISNQLRNFSDANPTANQVSGVYGATAFLGGACSIIMSANLVANMQTPATTTPSCFSAVVVQGIGGTISVAANLLKGNTTLI